MDLTTTARIKTYMDAGGEAVNADATYDAWIAVLITAHSQAIEAYLDRGLQQTSRTEQHDLEAGQRLVRLKAWPVASVTTVKNSSTRAFDSATALTEDSNFYVDKASGLLHLDNYIPVHGAGVLQVVYTGGLAVDTDALITAFPDLALACDMQITHFINRKDNPGASGLGVEGGNVSYIGGLDWLPVVKALLDRRKAVYI